MAQKPVFCAPLKNLVAVAEKRGDIPVMHGDTNLRSSEGGMMTAKVIIAHNFETKTYSIIEVYNPNWGCVLALGTSLVVMPPSAGFDNETEAFNGMNIDPSDSIQL